MWKGSIFHDIIADYLILVKKGNFSYDNILNNYENIIKKQWDCSFNNEYNDDIRNIGKNNVMGLMEHEYNQNIPNNSVLDIFNEMKEKFLNFYNWGVKNNLFKILFDSSEYWIEPLPYGPQAPGFYLDDIQVIAKVDLAIHDENGFNIYDWKSGQPAAKTRFLDNNELQVSVYQLWPHLQFKNSLDSIQAHLLYLGNNVPKKLSFKLDNNKKELILSIIKRSIAQMKDFHDLYDKNELSLDELDYSNHYNNCKLYALKDYVIRI